LERQLQALTRLGRVVWRQSAELLLSVVVAVYLLLVSGIAMFYMEHDAQPTVFGSIFDGFWWASTVLSLLCFGDLYPVTPVGKILGNTQFVL